MPLKLVGCFSPQAKCTQVAIWYLQDSSFVCCLSMSFSLISCQNIYLIGFWHALSTYQYEVLTPSPLLCMGTYGALLGEWS